MLLGQLGVLQMREARHDGSDFVYSMAESNLEESLTLWLDLQMSVHWSLKLSQLAQLYIDRGEAELAAPLLSRAEEAVSIYGSFPIVKNAVAQARCSWALSCGRLEEAHHALGRMAYFLEQAYTWEDDVRGHLLGAHYLGLIDQPDDAARRLQQAEDLLDELGCHPSYVLKRDLQRLQTRIQGADSPAHA